MKITPSQVKMIEQGYRLYFLHQELALVKGHTDVVGEYNGFYANRVFCTLQKSEQAGLLYAAVLKAFEGTMYDEWAGIMTQGDKVILALNEAGRKAADAVQADLAACGQSATETVIEIAGVKVLQLVVQGKRPGEGQIAADMKARKDADA